MRLLGILLLSALLAGCTIGRPVPTPYPTWPPPPRPTEAPDATALPTVSPADQVAAFYRPGVVYYPSYNGIHRLVFAPDGALWAATESGVVRWDLATDAPRGYGVPDGLGGDYVLSLTVAPDGAVWAGTGGGVSRFDGVAWTTFTTADGLPHDTIYALAVAPDGSVWAGTQAGAAHFSESRWIAYTVADGLADGLVWAIGIAADGDVWFSTHGGGVSRYRPRSNTWTTYAAGNGLPLPNARALAVGPDGAAWVHVGYDHVYRFDGKTWRLAYEVGGGRWVCDIAFDPDRQPWIATCDGWHAYGAGLAHFAGAAWVYATVDHGLVSNAVTAVAVRADGVIAAGSDRGISVFQHGTWRPLRRGPLLNRITAIAVTPDGAAWFAYGDSSWRPAGGGVSRFDGTTWRTFDATSGLPGSDNVRVLAAAPDGGLWAGAGCNLARYDGSTWQAIATCGQIRSNVHALAFGPAGQVWAAVDFELYHFDGQIWTTYENRIAGPVAVDREGRAWAWFSPLAGGGLGVFDGNDWRVLKDDLPFDYAGSLVATPDGALWATSGEGDVARFDGKTWKRYTVAEGAPSGPSLRLVVSPRGRLWGISNKGITQLEGETWVSHASGFEGVSAAAVAPDGSLWLGTARGVVHLLP